MGEYAVQSVTLLWLAHRIGVIEQCCQMAQCSKFFYKNGVILHACVHGRRKDLSRGALVDFSASFCRRGLKVVKFVFCHSKRRKRFFAKFFFRRPCLCVGKVRATPLKNWYNFKRINIILNSEILLNLFRKIKCLTDQIQFFDQIQLRRTRACFVYLCHNPRSSLH